MPGVHIIRKKATKEMRALWGPPQTDIERKAYHERRLLYPVIVVAPDEEYAFLPNFTFETVHQIAEAKAGGTPGIIYVHNDRIDAGAPKPTTPGLGNYLLEHGNRKLNTMKDLHNALVEAQQVEDERRRRDSEEYDRLLEEACAHSGPSEPRPERRHQPRQRLTDFVPTNPIDAKSSP